MSLLKDILLSAAEYAQKNPQKTVKIVSETYKLGKTLSNANTEPTPRMQIQTMTKLPVGAVRASEFYMRVNAIATCEDKTSDNLIAVSGNIESGELRIKEYLHFRAPKITPLCLQCVQILNDMKEDKRSTAQTGCSPLIVLKASSKAEIEIIRQCVGKYYSCRICNMDYKDKF